MTSLVGKESFFLIFTQYVYIVYSMHLKSERNSKSVVCKNIVVLSVECNKCVFYVSVVNLC